MPAKRETLFCRYRYDPLDRVADCAPLNRENIQRFYRQSRLATEIQGQVQHSVFQHDEQLLAHQRHEAGGVDSTLLATDQQRSVLYGVGAGQRQQVAYSPYGHRSPEGGLISLLGFNGERPDPVTGHYLLGNGYRAFNPVLMRFNSSDSLSPFGKGGLNAYAYCLGDPVNLVDPMGDFALIARGITHLVSAPIAAARQVSKGLSALKKGVVSSLKKPSSQFAATESGMKDLLRVNPEKHSIIVREAMSKANELNIYQAGADYRRAVERFTPLQRKHSKLQSLASSKGFPPADILKQPQLKNYPQALSDLQQAEKQLADVSLKHILKYPEELMPTHSLIGLIRGT